MSSELEPFIEASSFRENDMLYLNFTYTKDAKSEYLVEISDLFIRVELFDSKMLTSWGHSMQVNVYKRPIVPPSFVSPLPESYTVKVGNFKTFQLPEADASPYSMRSYDPIVVVIPAQLNDFMSFDSQ